MANLTSEDLTNCTSDIIKELVSIVNTSFYSMEFSNSKCSYYSCVYIYVIVFAYMCVCIWSVCAGV